MRLLLLALALLVGCAPDDTAPDAPEASGETTSGETASGDPAASGPEVALLRSPAGPESGRPRLSLTPDGTPLLSWSEPDGDAHTLRYSLWREGRWAEPETAARGEGWLVNWADTPGVIALAGGRFLAHTLPNAGGHAYDAAVSLSSGDGWTPEALLNTDGLRAEHGFVSAVPLGDRAGVVWLDGREQAGDHGHGGGPMQLRFAALSASGERSGETVLDARTCDCCPTAMAVTARGPVVAYRDRSEGEIRDVAVVRLVSGDWTEPTIPHADGWRIEGCPVNGPALAASGERVALAWFTAADDSARVQLTLSKDAGSTWGPALTLDDTTPIGRVDVALLASGDVAVSWLDASGDDAVLVVQRVSASGAVGAPVEVARTDASRSSGMPRIVAQGDGVLVAWTDPEADIPLQTASVRL